MIKMPFDVYQPSLVTNSHCLLSLCAPEQEQLKDTGLGM